MERLDPPQEAADVLPPKKRFLTDDQFEEVWNVRGMKFRIDELHVALLNRGLLVSVRQDAFRDEMRELLLSYFCKGFARRSPEREPKPKFPKVF